MPILLLAIFLKGPRWLRVLVLLAFGGLIVLACLFTARTFQQAVERTAPAYATHRHARLVHAVRF